MTQIFRAGIIGCGKIASDFADDPKMLGDIFTHAEAYTRCANTVLAAVCDSNPQQLERCGNRWNVSARYSDLKEMVRKESLDILSVSTPDSTHYQVIKDIFSVPNSIRGILCEKPLAATSQEAEEIIRIAEKYKVILAVMYMRRHAQNYQALKDFLRKGKLGEIQAIAGWYTKGVFHNGTHWLDALRYFAGEVEWVMAWNRLSDSQEDPTLDLVLGLRNRGIASLHALDSNAFTVFEMDIVGTRGRVRILDSGFEIEHSTVIESKRYSGYKELGSSPVAFGDRQNLMLHAVEDLVQAIKIGVGVKCSGQDGVAVLKIVEAALESAKSGKMVRI
jgi:predicted dehydrogenase